MLRNHRLGFGALALAALVGFAVPAAAQSAEVAPTKKDPLRFEAFAVQMQGGMAGMVMITIERWTTEEERNALVGLLANTTIREQDQEKLVKALQDIKERAGYLNTPNSMGWDIKYAYQTQLADGSRQVVVVTDKPVSFFAASRNTRTMDYAFTLIEMRFPKGSDKGEGKLLGQTSLSVKDGKLQIEIYGQEPTRLTQITEKNPKVKK
jgi:hypothetical protein